MGPFCPNLGKKEFFCKKGLCQFSNIPTIYHRAKNAELTDGRTDSQTNKTDRQTNRRTENGDLIGAPEGRGSKK